MAKTYDIAVLGATTAGYVAAIALARKGHDVALIEARHQQAESPLADWVPRGFFKLSAMPTSLAKRCGFREFSQVVYHNADLSRQVEYTSRAAMGHFLNPRELEAALRKTAVKEHVKIRPCKSRPTVHLHEESVTVTSAGQSTSAKILLVAHNRPGEVIGQLALPVQNVPQPPMVVAALDVPLGARADALDGALHVVECRERSDLGMYFVAKGDLHIRLMSASVASGSRAEELSAMVSKLQKSGLVPPELPLGKARGAVWYPPAGIALDLETHVAKRCVLIGTAGGFAESITGQTLYPGVRSAMIAADVAGSALSHKNVQEDLSRFKTAWRKNLAGYLRPPNTSLQMLLPLLFVNQQIVAKFTRALLFGETI